ncbi:MAG: hypothetical protein V4717_14520 [Bacteroidota bacterium]
MLSHTHLAALPSTARSQRTTKALAATAKIQQPMPGHTVWFVGGSLGLGGVVSACVVWASG